MSNTVKAAPAKPAASMSTKDSGRVQIGAGVVPYASQTDTKSTHDAGRVQIGSGLMRF